MSEQRMIQCPECVKRRTTGLPLRWALNCGTCGEPETHLGTITDRRAPTAAERAVEKALARADEVANYATDSRHGEGYKLGCADMARIIREEAERG